MPGVARRPALSLLPAAFACLLATSAARADPLDVPRARELDRQGVRAYAEGRYRDALTFFGESLRAGAPPTEIWNMAKCHVKLDEPEEAAALFEQYLGSPGIEPADRDGALRELDALKKRPSVVAIDSTPRGARISVDGRSLGRSVVTPRSITLPPGHHVIGFAKDEKGVSKEIDLEYGRAGVAFGDLAAPEESPAVGLETRRYEVGIAATLSGANAGDGSGFSSSPGLEVAGFATVWNPRYELAVGLAASASRLGWGNALGDRSAPLDCGGLPLESSFVATEWSVALLARGRVPLSERVSFDTDLGVGVATLSSDHAGGDLFRPSCTPSFGVVPLVRIDASLTVRATEAVRIAFRPLGLEVHPAFGGARPPADGAWWRLGGALGVVIAL